MVEHEEEIKDIVVHKGLENIYVDQTDICDIDGKNGQLWYRGYPIDELVEKSTFEETAYLVLYGKLPTQPELDEFSQELMAERNIPDNILTFMKSFPRNTTRIELLRTAISALSLYDPDDYDYSQEANCRKGIRIIAKMPTIIAFAHRIEENLKLVEPRTSDLSLAANFFYMMTGRIPTVEVEKAFDKLLICHADHGVNASTFAARVTVSTLSDIYSGIVSAIGALRGPLHGGANERVVKFLLHEVKKKENVIPWAAAKLTNKELIMGFGHRVYKTWDPRAIIIRDISKSFYELRQNACFDYACGEIIDPEAVDNTIHAEHDPDIDDLFEMTEILTDYMIKTKNLYPNVDLYSGGLLHALGVPSPIFTPLFAAARSVGWVAHSIEQLSNNRLIRPRLLYTGQNGKIYVPIEERE
ncbi:MAG TPA: citrate/2-methylcitrate synthase [Candidatus Lokiarchaeia archaeon]|nr:citrate/2-methylcitrate synthase [Candidatus Lokiarchaeia archaeon]